MKLETCVAGLGVAPSLGDYASVDSSLDECRTMSCRARRLWRIVSTDFPFGIFPRRCHVLLKNLDFTDIAKLTPPVAESPF